MNKFFFITTYDNITGTVLSSIVNSHPDVNCHVSHAADSLSPTIFPLPKNAYGDAHIDKYIRLNNTFDKMFSGCSRRFSALELKHKTLVEKTATPYISANILLSPATRVNYILQDWMKSNLEDSLSSQFIENQLKAMQKEHHNLFKLYIFHYFYNQITSIVNENKMAPLNVSKNKLFILALAVVITYDSADISTPCKKFSFEKLLSSSDECLTLIKYLTKNKCRIDDNFKASLEQELKIQKAKLDNLNFPEWEKWQTELLSIIINKRLLTIYYPHIDKSLSTLYAEAGYELVAKSEKPLYKKLISIQLNSNRPAQLSAYFDNIEETADDPTQIEVLVNIDIGSISMKSLLDSEIPQRTFTLKYIETPRPNSFCDLWKPINNLLTITDPDAYFLLNISDEMLFETQGWDSILKKYVGYFPDHLFRLRASRNKFRNYFDRWECSFAQDAIPITTKKWVDTGGNWNPCFGPDSFQQLIALYLAREGKFSNTNYLREAPITEIKFSGDVPALGIDPAKAWGHNKDHIIAMQICQSYKMQLEARRRAILIKTRILANKHQVSNFSVIDNPSKKIITLYDHDKKLTLESTRYHVNRLAIVFTNQFRKLAFFTYFGDGRRNRKNILITFYQYLKARHFLFAKLHSKIPLFYLLLSKLKKFNPKKIFYIRAKFKNYCNKHPLKEENQYLREIYNSACIENEKLKNIVAEKMAFESEQNSLKNAKNRVKEC
jgi:hypothetical protein